MNNLGEKATSVKRADEEERTRDFGRYSNENWGLIC